MPGLKAPMWNDESVVATVLSFADIADQFHVQYDNKIDNRFHVKSWKEEDGVDITFDRDNVTRLYGYKFTEEFMNRNVDKNKPQDNNGDNCFNPKEHLGK